MYVGFVVKNELNKGIDYDYHIKKVGCNDAEFLAHQIIFSLAGPDEQFIRDVLNVIKKVLRDLDDNAVPDAVIPADNDYYVYGYFYPNNFLWNQVYYIGKGTGGRALEHIRNAHRRPPAPNINLKEDNIRNWLRLQGNYGNINQLIIAQGHEVVRKLYSFSGDCAEHKAFFVEYCLISRAQKNQALGNDTGGNRRWGGYVALAQPGGFCCTNAVHRNLWASAIDVFLADPTDVSLGQTRVPGLRFIGFESDIDSTTELLRKFGITPFPMKDAPENRLTVDMMVRDHVSVSGASDAMMSYRSNESNFRFDLRITSGSTDTIINLRPLSNRAADIEKFINYMEKLTLNCVTVSRSTSDNSRSLVNLYGQINFIKNRNSWPYVKPTHFNANGRLPVTFNLLNPNKKTKFDSNWINPNPACLSFAEVMKLISKSWI